MRNKMNIRNMWLTLIFLLLFTPSLHGAEIVVQTGVASPQSGAEEGNIEKLRERAIRNAMDLAVIQVSGVLVSGERGDTIRSRENITIYGDEVVEQTKQQSRFHRNTILRNTGHARLVEIVREWRDSNQYFVEAKVEVGTPEETTKKINAGFYWERAGKPSIALSFNEKTNGEVTTVNESRTLLYLRDNLVKNGITTSTKKMSDMQYVVNVTQMLQTKHVASFDSYTTHCQLSFQIVDQVRGETVAEYRAKHGPNAGFSMEQAQESCIQAIAPAVSEKLVRKIAGIMRDRWNNGVEYQLSIIGLPGNIVTEASNVLTNLFRVSSSTGISYQNNILQLMMKYKGTGIDLAEAVRSSFDELDWKITPEVIKDSRVRLLWINQK